MTFDEVMNSLPPDQLPEGMDLGDMNAPEAGTFLPRLKPGEEYRFRFLLEESQEDDEHPQRNRPFALVDREWPVESGKKVKFLQVSWIAEIDPTDQPDKFNGETEPIRIRFNRANSYKHPKMKISEMGDLLRCLGVDISQITTIPALRDKLVELDAQGAMGTMVAGWNTRFDDGTEFTTGRPQKEREYTNGNGETVKVPSGRSWPRDANGGYAESVTWNGVTQYGRDFVQVLKVPKIPF